MPTTSSASARYRQPAFLLGGRSGRWNSLVTLVLVSLLGVLAVTATQSASAQDPTQKKLRMGDPVPPLDGDWVGEARPQFAQGNVYLVLMWNQSSVASRKALLQLKELGDKYAGQVGLVLFGQESIEDLSASVQGRGLNLNGVPIGSDKNKTAWKAWVNASGFRGNLALFIVDRERRVVWVGDPGDGDLLNVLPRVLDNRYDPIAEAQAAPAIQAARNAAKIRNFREAYQHYDTAIAINPRLFSDIALEKYKFMVTEARDPEAGKTYGKLLVSQIFHDEPSSLIDLALMIASDADIKEKDLELADSAIKRILALSAPSPRPTDPSVLSRLASYQFALGNIDAAAEAQMEAWMIAPESAKPAYRVKLEKYRKAKKDAAANATGGAK